MNAIIHRDYESVVCPCGITELVRGNEQRLLDRISPMVREQNVTLDLRSVVRIDAAGIAALIKLYGCARDAGHRFSVRNVSARVKEILTIVGLEPILVSHDAVRASQSAACCEQPAA
jgi:anti-anti-sigma factor